MSPLEQIQQHLRSLRMPAAVETVADLLTTATRETWSFETFLSELLGQELEGRSQRRIERLQKSSRLPAGKTLAAFDQKNCPCASPANWLNYVAATLLPAPKTCSSFACPGWARPTSPPPLATNWFRLGAVSYSPPPFTWWTNSCGQSVTCCLSASCAALIPTK